MAKLFVDSGPMWWSSKKVFTLVIKRSKSRSTSRKESPKVEDNHARAPDKQPYLSVAKVPSDAAFAEWCKHVDSLDINLEVSSNFLTALINSKVFGSSFSWEDILTEFRHAIQCYKELAKDCEHLPEISNESARRFLLLAPLLVGSNPKIYLDTQNGCFTVDIITRENGILSVQISPMGAVYYSCVEEHNRIYKITGTAKFKCSHDYIKFSKILRMI